MWSLTSKHVLKLQLLFALIDLGEKVTGERGNRKTQRQKRYQEEFKSISGSSVSYSICLRVLLEMRRQWNSVKYNEKMLMAL